MKFFIIILPTYLIFSRLRYLFILLYEIVCIIFHFLPELKFVPKKMKIVLIMDYRLKTHEYHSVSWISLKVTCFFFFFNIRIISLKFALNKIWCIQYKVEVQRLWVWLLIEKLIFGERYECLKLAHKKTAKNPFWSLTYFIEIRRIGNILT